MVIIGGCGARHTRRACAPKAGQGHGTAERRATVGQPRRPTVLRRRAARCGARVGRGGVDYYRSRAGAGGAAQPRPEMGSAALRRVSRSLVCGRAAGLGVGKAGNTLLVSASTTPCCTATYSQTQALGAPARPPTPPARPKPSGSSQEHRFGNGFGNFLTCGRRPPPPPAGTSKPPSARPPPRL